MTARTGAATSRVLEALEAAGSVVKLSPTGQHSATCPAHSDGNPSLGIFDNGNGRCLMICRAGCETSTVLEALGLRSADLFDSPRGTTWEYDDGRKVHRASGTKKFTQSGNTKAGPGRAALFRLDQVKWRWPQGGRSTWSKGRTTLTR